MQIVRSLPALREAIATFRQAGETVALVPTMGALHAGHMALVAAGRLRADRVVTSIFVNPRQFGPNDDLATYPRREAHDAKMLADGGCAVLWAPSVDEMYPAGFSTSVAVSGIADVLDGVTRPNHFDGVATVVVKLFNQVQPDIALFGEKDFQQVAVVRRMVRDLDMTIEIVSMPTQRDDDGLALSSRNAFLGQDERISARALPRALGEAAEALRRGEAADGVLAAAKRRLSDAGFGPIDYLDLRDAETLEPVDSLVRPARLLAAARMGKTRLIDNLAV